MVRVSGWELTLPASTDILIKKPLANNRIRAREVRVIDEKGKQIGVLELGKALHLARERDLDLVQVTERVDPPICKLVELRKYLYQLEKKERLSRKQQTVETKGIRLGFNISSHDLGIKARLAKKFLEKGDRVRIEMRLRGRQKALRDFAKEKIKNFLDILGQSLAIKIEGELKMKPQGLIMFISADKKAKG